ncbi:hypothetical protein F4777DRAFT_554138 [Nemania sp. FL0916]|nr:hypothetical protein F4777DRAFT_554138 [Nemania sp. FL0916]
MSPVAYSGAATPPSNGTMAANGRSRTAAPARNGTPGGVYGGNSGSSGSSGPRKEPFRHIDDIVSVSVDLDPHATMRRVLEAGDAHMQQAVTFKSFNRPDLALQEYIKAFTIAVDKVPKHKDYPALRADRGDLSRLYQALKVKITNNGVAYDQIKEMIKDDNSKSGVRPKNAVHKLSDNSLFDLPSVPSNAPMRRSIDTRGDGFQHNRKGDNAGSTSAYGPPMPPDPQSPDRSTSGRKARPTVHPKPKALHGNSIKPALDTASPDLVARFAKLRASQESQNNSSPASLVKPAGPRAMPSAQQLPLSVRSSLPAMPKIPDAVYSPARGTVTSEAANLPSSTPRGMFSRTNSIVSVSGASSRTSMDSLFRTSNREQFVTAHTYGDSQPAPSSNLRIPAGDLITVQEFLRCVQDASTSPNTKILLIDVRDRQLFDEGHIMSQNTICLDPTIVSRPNISASEIVDSMILAPTSEKAALERRDEFDLIVFYDQDSESMPQRISANLQQLVLFNLYQALVHFSYPKQLTHTPKLLVGGLDSWIDEMGSQSLQTSKTQSIVGQTRANLTGSRRRLRNRTLKPEEVNTFEAMIGRDETGDFDYAKTREDFMRRYPSIREPESMVSTEQDGSLVQSTASGGEEFLKDMTPIPPVRPKPSVARTRYSGLESADDHPPVSGLAMTASTSINMGTGPLTGLVNPHNWCYANSSIQALLASRGFMDEFLDTQWPTKYRPNVSRTDPAYNQLMCRILGNLFQWLVQRNFANMKAATLMHYLRTIHSGYQLPNNETVRFGDAHQHDSDELITFVFGQLEVETRIKLTKNTLPALDTTQPVGFIVDRWASRPNHSVVSRHWYLMELHTFTCNNCQAKNYLHAESERYGFPVPPNTDNGTLETLFTQHFADQTVDSVCDVCSARGKTLRKRVARLPPLLRVGIQRTDQSNFRKLTNHLRFPFSGLDLSSYTLDAGQRTQIAQTLGGEAADGFNSSCLYDLYAVVSHVGPNVNSGHYICHTKADDDNWTRCADTTITPNISKSTTQTTLYTCKDGFTPVQLYYRRRG